MAPMSHPYVVHSKREEYDVYIGRPSKWGNPYTHLVRMDGRDGVILVGTREEAVAAYEAHLLRSPDLLAALSELRGKVLGCWCAPEACHGDVLARYANEGL